VSRSNSNQWHWDNHRHRWVYTGGEASLNPTYRWEIAKGKTIYHNDLMMRAIDVACANMTEFPDAAQLIEQARGTQDDFE